MALDLELCSRARLSRDARFDGKFFIAVKSTGIYCRPICRARTSKESNVRYYETAAEATEAGFRPCLRCRPESSPGTPAWLGTRNTVSRALRLIHENGLVDGGIDALADKLGVGSRHLRRLFVMHLGATPSAVAQTMRMHFAKKLLDETSLSMTQIAMASGFGSVRRFNDAFRQLYRRTPTEIRRLSRRADLQAQNEYTFRLDHRPPYHWPGMLSFLAARATSSVEAVENDTYRRSFLINGTTGVFQVSRHPADDALVLRVQIADPSSLFAIIGRVREIFDLDADWSEIARNLSSDPMLCARLNAVPGLRVAGSWDRFELLVCAVMEHQSSTARATQVAGDLATKYGEPIQASGTITRLFPTPAALADADLTNVGLTRPRADTVRALARAVARGEIDLNGMGDSDLLFGQLGRFPEIDEWVAQYFAMRALREPDAFPAGDVDLLCALNVRTARQLQERAELWRPWRSYAAMYLWDTTLQSAPIASTANGDGSPLTWNSERSPGASAP